ncbi:unnamed protein product [Rotaria socialis]
MSFSAKPSKEEVKRLFKQFDNGNGHLSLAEIDRAVTHFYPQLGIKKNAIMRAYKAADISGNGLVELKEFAKILELLHYYNKLREDSNDESYLKNEFKQVDTNNGGFILFDEFCMYMANRKVE